MLKTDKKGALALQLILFEIIKARKTIKSLQRALESKNPGKITKNALARLASRQTEDKAYITWHLNDGSFNRIKNYSSNIPDNSEIRKYGDLALKACIKAYDLKNGCFKSEWKKIILYYYKLAAATEKLLDQYRKNENVLFFLLRHHRELDDLFQKRYTANAIKKSFPEGPEEARRYLTVKFRKRGFDHLLPIIDNKIKKLKIRCDN